MCAKKVSYKNSIQPTSYNNLSDECANNEPLKTNVYNTSSNVRQPNLKIRLGYSCISHKFIVIIKADVFLYFFLQEFDAGGRHVAENATSRPRYEKRWT